MFKRILVPLDGSTLAEGAIPMAARIARASGGSVILLRVVSPPLEYGYGPYMLQTPMATFERALEADLTDATHYLQGVATSSDLANVETHFEVHSGLSAPMIFSTVDSKQIDLIVMSSHGTSGIKRWMLGSVAQKIARHASVPVLVLRDHRTPPAGPHPYIQHPMRVLVPLDGSAFSRTALQPAADLIAALAPPGQGAMHLARIVKLVRSGQGSMNAALKEQILYISRIEMSAITDQLRAVGGQGEPKGIAAEHNLTVTWSVVFDTDIADALIRIAENGEDAEGAGVFGGCSLIAMATHGRSGLQRWAMGSITERVLDGIKLPLLIVRPQNVETDQEANDQEVVEAV